VAALGLYAVLRDPPGLQGDEAFFLIAIRQPETTAYSLDVPGLGVVSLMINSYVGTIKAGILALLFRMGGPSVVAARLFGLGALLLSGALFYRLVRRFAPRGWAWLFAAALLLDPSYAVTSILDWGPVALQHIFLLLVLLGLLRAIEHRSSFWAWVAGLCAGLGMWDKALFVFPLFGAAVALLLLSAWNGRWREWRMAIPFAVGAAIGAAPFLLSLTQRAAGPSAIDLAQFELRDFGLKAVQMARTLDGTILRGFLANMDATPDSITAGTRTFGLWLGLVSLALLAPVVRSRFGSVALAVIVGGTVAWAAMALVRTAAYAAHHTILFWPAPFLFLLFVALAWTERKPRLAQAVLPLLALAAFQNARVLFELRQTAMRHGYAKNWTDAQYPTVEALLAESAAGSRVLLGDWGLKESIYLLSHGRLDLPMVSDVYWQPDLRPEDLQEMAERMEGAERVALVYRVPADAAFPHVRPAAEQAALGRGFLPGGVRVIADRVGAPRFEIVSYRRP
jgi:hypothetical protein